MLRPRALSVLSSISVASLFAVAVGCSSSSSKPDGAAGTTGSAGSGGTAGKGGTTGTAGKGGTGGTTGTAGSGGAPGSDAGGPICGNGVPAPMQTIANFDDLSNTAFGVFGDPVTGATYESGTYLAEDFSGGSWRLQGIAFGQQSYFGLYWTCLASPTGGCTLDVSKYTGIQFTIKGNVGPDHMLGFSIGRPEDDTQPENAMCGTCTTTKTPTSIDCHGPRTTITVPSDGSTTTVKLSWADFTGGAPVAGLAANVPITGIIWYFHDAAGDAGVDGGLIQDAGLASADGGPTGPAYPVDFIVDSIQFTTAAVDGATGN